MNLLDVHFQPVVIAAVIQFLFGWLWYSPCLFGKVWESHGCCKEGCQPGAVQWIGGFLVSLVTAWVFAAILNHFVVVDIRQGAELGFYIWLGFIATKIVSAYIWTKMSFPLLLINAGHQLISLVFFGAFLTYWK